MSSINDSATETSDDEEEEVCLYDAVAGRVGYEGFIAEPGRFSRYRDTTSKSTVALPPDEILFQDPEAPIRYGENDIYFAERYLEPSQQLPDSDLLKALHCYASDFYASRTEKGGKKDFLSLDETALLALGILIEEAAYEGLGETGDLALVESEDEQSDDSVIVKKEEDADDMLPKVERSVSPVVKMETDP